MENKINTKTVSDGSKIVTAPITSGFVNTPGLQTSRTITYDNDMFKDISATLRHPIDKFEQEYPELSDEFKKIQHEQYDTFCRKMLSYGLHNISVGTNLETEEEKQLALTGVWFRINDKIQRLKQMVLLKKDNPLDDEPVEDAFKDLSVYGIICLLVKAGKWKK